MQWEFAAKHAALWPATLKGTYWRAWYELAIAHRLSRSAFTPAPAVDAAVLRITPRFDPLVPAADRDRYWRFLDEAFRRKTTVRRAVRSQLSSLELKRLAALLGFSSTALPRDLDARQWAGVFTFASRRTRTTRTVAPKTADGPQSK